MRESGPRIHPGEENKESKGIVEKTREAIYNVMTESRIPSEDYKSTLGVWGGKLAEQEDGKLVYDNRGVISTIDRKGDAVLRTFDEHVAKEPFKMLKEHPKWFFKFLFSGPKRHRGNTEEIAKNIEKLGLQEYYGQHANGIEIKKPEIYKHGRVLQDVFRSDIIGSEKLTEVDRMDALKQGVVYVKEMHESHGGIGELNPGDIIFQESDGKTVSKPVLNLPDIVYNNEKEISENEKKATDLLDLMMSTGVEELRRSQEDWDSVSKVLDTIITTYNDKDMKRAIKSLAKRGRLVLQGDQELLNLPDSSTKTFRPVLAQHNKARLGVMENISVEMRKRVIEACTEKEVKN